MSDAGAIVMPKRLGLGVILVLMTIAAHAAVVEHRINGLEADAQAEASVLRKMQINLCKLCVAQLGPGACDC